MDAVRAKSRRARPGSGLQAAWGVLLTRRMGLALAGAAVLAAAGVAWSWPRREELVLTGIVVSDDVLVSAQVGGRLRRMDVREGDAVSRGSTLAVIEPVELEAERAYFAHAADETGAQVAENAAALRYQVREGRTAVAEAEANLSVAEANVQEAVAAQGELRTTFERAEALLSEGAIARQEYDRARSALDIGTARRASCERQVLLRRAEMESARARSEQVALRQSALRASEAQRAAAEAQHRRAEVRLGYTEVTAPISGVVTVRAARMGEVVNPGQPIVSLVDLDDLWVRVDVEETYVDRIRLGDRLKVILPSGAVREGTVFYRAVDGGFATQRDVSRTKRDIRTFEVRLRVPNTDRALAVGMTCNLELPLGEAGG